MKCIVNNLKMIRKNRNFTRGKIAEILGTSPVTVYRWEAGLVTPKLKTILRLAELYKCSIDNLFPIHKRKEE